MTQKVRVMGQLIPSNRADAYSSCRMSNHILLAIESRKTHHFHIFTDDPAKLYNPDQKTKIAATTHISPRNGRHQSTDRVVSASTLTLQYKHSCYCYDYYYYYYYHHCIITRFVAIVGDSDRSREGLSPGQTHLQTFWVSDVLGRHCRLLLDLGRFVL